MKQTMSSPLRQSFVVTTSLEGHAYVCHFLLQDSAESYLVVVLNKRFIKPFLMDKDVTLCWRIKGPVPATIKALELRLIAAIIDNNKS